MGLEVYCLHVGRTSHKMQGSSSIDRAAPTVHEENQIFQFDQIDHLSAAYDSKTASGIHLYCIHRACGNDSAIGFRRRTRRFPGARTIKHAPAWSATSARPSPINKGACPFRRLSSPREADSGTCEMHSPQPTVPSEVSPRTSVMCR